MTRESQKKHLKQLQERPQPVRYILQFLFNLGDRFSSLLLLTHCTVTIIDRFFVIVIFIIIIHIFAVRQLVHFYCKLIVSGVPINPNRHGSFQTKKKSTSYRGHKPLLQYFLVIVTASVPHVAE
jgi:hypothetical protein